MRLDDVLKLDIKLLVAFSSIMEEGSVSRAADKLGMTQPALSKSLQRLREVFNDCLFTRQAYGLTPTARATELNLLIQPILNSIEELMAPNKLDLKSLDRRFKIRVNEGDLEHFIEPLLASIYDESPNLKLSFTSWGDTHFEQLVSGDVDIGIQRVSETPSNIRSKLVGHMEVCIVLSNAHPLFEQDYATLSEFLEHKTVTHIRSNNPSSTFAKTANILKRQGYTIEPELETDSLMVAMQAVKQGMALVTSRSIGQLFLEIMGKKSTFESGPDNFHPIKLLPIPQEIIEVDDYNGHHPIHIFWHERFNNDLAHRWLREKFIEFMRNSDWIHVPK